MTTAAAIANETETVVLLPVDKCHRSPSQPRRRGPDKLTEDFVSSIREKGVLQPIVARVRKAGGWEIVFGHRRHEGSVIAERATIPAIVRELSDDDVFEAQLIENVHREDMHPLDEADGFKRMIEKSHRTVQQVADRIGRPIAYVAQRLKLCELGPAVRTALDKGEITLGVAVVLARVPSSLQAEALKLLWRGIGAAEAKSRLEETYLMRLDQAPFDVASVTLVSKAGACTVCPKRTGQQKELFADVKSPDLCTDRVCYRSKLDAVWQIRKVEAKAGGRSVIEGKASKEISQGYSREYRKLDEQDYTVNKKVGAILGKDHPSISLVRDERSGAIIEVAKRADVEKAIRKIRPETKSGGADNYRAADKRRDEKAKLRVAAGDLAIAKALETKTIGLVNLVRLMSVILIDRAYEDAEQIATRRGIEFKKGKGREALRLHLNKMPDAQVANLGLELALMDIAPGKFSPAEAIWGETMKALGVNFAAIEKKVAADAKATKAAKGKKKPAAKKAAAK